MANLSEKELTAIEDQLNEEVVLIKKCRSYGNLCTDPALKSLCNQTADKHQAHFDTLMNHLS